MNLFRFFWLHMFVRVSTLAFFGRVSDASELFFGNKIPEKTPDPINIDSEKVQKVFTLSPFSLQANLNDRVTVVNNGKSVEINLNQFFTLSRVTGGVLRGDQYRFQKIKYLWTNNLAGVSGTTINKKGYPLENVAIFYNEKYESFENALNYRDGLAEVVFFIDICPARSNVEFNKYDEILQQVKEAGSTAKTTLGTAIRWFAGEGFLPPTSAYYAYPGSYVDEVTSKRYYCTTVIILPHLPQWCLSREQYEETFGAFKNSSGSPLTNTESQYPQKMPVVQARGILNFNF